MGTCHRTGIPDHVLSMTLARFIPKLLCVYRAIRRIQKGEKSHSVTAQRSRPWREGSRTRSLLRARRTHGPCAGAAHWLSTGLILLAHFLGLWVILSLRKARTVYTCRKYLKVLLFSNFANPVCYHFNTLPPPGRQQVFINTFSVLTNGTFLSVFNWPFIFLLWGIAL